MTPVQVEFALNIPEARTQKFLGNAARFVQSTHTQLKNSPYIMVLADSTDKTNRLSFKDVRLSCGSGKSVLFVDEELHLIKADVGDGKLSICSKLTDTQKLFAVLIADTYVYQVLAGKIVDEGDLLKPIANPLSGPNWHRPISDFDALLKDHFDNHIKSEQLFRYWADKSKRILLSGKNGTEEIFHRSLFWWLKNYVSNQLKVYAQPKGLGQDETDIIVVTIEGSHLTEVKWLGKNEGGTAFDQDHINDGLAQIKIYLDGDNECVCGYLIFYDGRPAEENQTQSTYNDALRHPRCAAPKILFLESETPRTINIMGLASQFSTTTSSFLGTDGTNSRKVSRKASYLRPFVDDGGTNASSAYWTHLPGPGQR